MNFPLNIPGIGIISLESPEEVLRLQGYLDILSLAGQIDHTNLDSQARGSELDPFNVTTNPGSSTQLPMGFSGVQIVGYTQVEWEKIFGTTKYNPYEIASKSFKDSISSPVDRLRAQKQASQSRTSVAGILEEGIFTAYTMSEWKRKYPIVIETEATRFTDPIPSFSTLKWNSLPPIVWDCADDVVEVDVCLGGCTDIDCSDPLCITLMPMPLPICTPPNINPPAPPPPFYASGYSQNLAYLSRQVNGLYNIDARTIRWKACSGTGYCYCATSLGTNCTGKLGVFILGGIPATHPLFPMVGWYYAIWEEFMADCILNGYPGATTDDYDDLIAYMMADPILSTQPVALGPQGVQVYMGVTVWLCSPTQQFPCPTITYPPVSLAGYCCTDSTGSTMPLIPCKNATATCGGNNCDGAVAVAIECIANCLQPYTLSGDADLIDQTGTVLSTITWTSNSVIAWLSFEDLCLGGYTVHVYNIMMTNTAPPTPLQDMNIQCIVLGDDPLNCLPGDPNYDSSCCEDPCAPPLEETNCDCEPGQNCEECGNNLIY
tara:strand:- start:918 stop:2555 length:1638 start_codon:yes stop_codon:yes gene_type:complete